MLSTSPIHPGDLHPAIAGVGFKPQHIADIGGAQPGPGWFEVHTENYLCEGGPRLKQLGLVRRDYPISLHGVSLSLGGAGALDQELLRRTRLLIERFQPALISEHLSWSSADGIYLNDLLPIPLTPESLTIVADHIDEAQNALGREILVENPSSYLRFEDNVYSEFEFLGELVRQTGCGLLLDINNLYVSGKNLGFDPISALQQIPTNAVGQIHLAGHAVNAVGDTHVHIDDHGSPVADPVWGLFQKTLSKLGPKPTLIEWDTDVPAFSDLLADASRAGRMLTQVSQTSGTRQ